MITYLNGDNFSYKELLKEWTKDNSITFSSRRKWFMKVVPFTFLSGALLSLIPFIVLCATDFLKGRTDRIDLTLFVSTFPLILWFIAIVCGSYYQAFVGPSKARRKVKDFIAHHIPHATKIRETSPNLCRFEWHGEPFDIRYCTLKEPNEQGLLRKKKYFHIWMWYVCDRQQRTTFEYTADGGTRVAEEYLSPFDEEGKLKKEFIEDLQAFGTNKPACRGISINNQTWCLELNLKETKASNRDVEESLDMLLYLSKRFHLIPVNRRGPLDEVLLQEWMDKMLEDGIPEHMNSFSLLMYEGVRDSFFVEFRGTYSFDQNDYDWIGRDVVMTGKRPFIFTEKQSGEVAMQKLMWGMIQYLAQKYEVGELSQIEGIGIDHYDKNLGIIYSKEEIISATK